MCATGVYVIAITCLRLKRNPNADVSPVSTPRLVCLSRPIARGVRVYARSACVRKRIRT